MSPPPPPKSEGVQYTTGEEQRGIAPERIKQMGQNRDDVLLWICLIVKAKPDAVKNNIT